MLCFPALIKPFWRVAVFLPFKSYTQIDVIPASGRLNDILVLGLKGLGLQLTKYGIAGDWESGFGLAVPVNVTL